MSASNNDALANLELATVQQRYRELIFPDDLPLMGLTARNIAEKAGITFWHWEMHVDSYREIGAKLTSALGCRHCNSDNATGRFQLRTPAKSPFPEAGRSLAASFGRNLPTGNGKRDQVIGKN